jgi:hypothetical protein
MEEPSSKMAQLVYESKPPVCQHYSVNALFHTRLTGRSLFMNACHCKLLQLGRAFCQQTARFQDRFRQSIDNMFANQFLEGSRS